jgi:type I restriction enzyme S subunit
VAPGYKVTELGPLPDDWDTVDVATLHDRGLLELRNGFPCGRHNDEGRGTPHLRPFNVAENGTIALEKIIYCEPAHDISRYLLREGDVVFNNTNSEALVGKTALWSRRDGTFVPSNHMTLVRVLGQNGPDPAWLALQLQKLYQDRVFQALCRRHVNQASVSIARLRSVRLPYPPPREQRRIAAILTTIRRAIDATEKVITAARELKKSLMRHLFTYGPVPIDQADKVPLKETEIGPVPDDWRVVTMAEAVEFLQYGTSERAASDGTGLPVLGIPHVVRGRIDALDLRYLALPETRANRLKLVTGDLLFVRTNASRERCGRCAIYRGDPPDALFASYLIRARVKESVALPEFVHAFANTAAGQAQLSGRASGAADGKFNINTQIIKSVALPAPPLHQQREIVETIRTADRKLETEHARKSALEALFKTMLHLMMTGRVRMHSEVADG